MVFHRIGRIFLKEVFPLFIGVIYVTFIFFETFLQLFPNRQVSLFMKAKTLLITTLATLSLVNFAAAEGKDCKKGEKMSPEKKAELLALYDADGDGQLNEEERQEARAAHKAKVLEKYDSDGDGELSKEEKQAMVLERFDEDGDGELSEEEKKKAHEARKKHGGKKGKGGKKKGSRNEQSE